MVRFPGTQAEGHFEQAGQRFSVESLDKSKLENVLRALAFDHSIHNTGGWCPIQLARDGQRWTTDTKVIPGIVDQAFRCWFNCDSRVFSFRALSATENPQRLKARRLLNQPLLAQTADKAVKLEGLVYDGESIQAGFICNEVRLRIIYIEDWEGGAEPTDPSDTIEGVWLWQLSERLAHLENLGGKRYSCSLGGSSTPSFGKETRRIEIDLQAAIARVYYSGLGSAPLLRSADGAVVVDGRFRCHAGNREVSFSISGRPLCTTHKSSSSTAMHSGFKHDTSEELGPWVEKNQIGLTFLNLAKNNKTWQLEPEGPDQWSYRHSEDDSHHDITSRSRCTVELDTSQGLLTIETSSHMDFT
jgi:hypothetical protein